MPERPINQPRAILHLGASQEGVFRRADVEGAGLSTLVLRRLVDEGAVTREARGLYRVGAAEATPAQRLALATVAVGGVISHESAGRYWGWERPAILPVHVTVPRGGSSVKLDWVTVHTSGHDLADLTSRCSGRPSLKVTKAMWTLSDLAAAGRDYRDVKHFLDHCLSSRMFRWATFERFVMGRPAAARGLPLLRAVLADGAEVDSQLESELLRLIRNAGIDRPVSQYRVRGPDGSVVAVLDAAWPRLAVSVEVDGFKFHSAHAAFVRDRRRHNHLTALGWTVLHATAADIRSTPQNLVRDLEAALARAAGARRGAGGGDCQS
ncbi:MAG: type IV toxin-antitoxin system AbiEi family antitoxin domain-containing protein [Acidimicrobiales bacterium]